LEGDVVNTILGINAYHGDSSACLVVDGKLVAAAASVWSDQGKALKSKEWA
jgi:predicted NodU family carbamoyl transferase